MRGTGRNLDLFAATVTPTKQKSSSDPIVPRLDRAKKKRLPLQTVIESNANNKKTVTQLWLAIHLPRWALDALHLQPSALPRVVVEAQAQQKIHACNQAAEKLGVKPGMPLNAAYVLSGSLQVLARDLQREKTELERLAEWLCAFTSRVSIEPPDGLLLEVKGSLRLFGGARALHERVSLGLQSRHFHAQLSMAPTAIAALNFARTATNTEPCIIGGFEELRVRLAALPITQLRWPFAVEKLLEAIGVQTIGDCLRLPRDGLARRIGPALLLELDQMTGRLPQVRRHFVPRERFVARYDFDMEVSQVDQLEQALQPMLEQLERFLRIRQAAVQALKLTLPARNTENTLAPVIVRFATLAWTQAQMWTVLKERLSRITLSTPVLAVRLRSSALLPLQEGVHNNDLFVRTIEQDPQRIVRLVERLRARLGEYSVYGLSLLADHRPELAWQRSRVVPSSGDTKYQVPQTPRPLWLLSVPQALRIENSHPCYHGRLSFEQGPERIESGWWDGHDVTRDYYIVRSAVGQRLWVYRERHAPHLWFLHGFFS
jgi:protein ImuB